MARTKRVRILRVPIYVAIKNGRKKLGFWTFAHLDPAQFTAGADRRPQTSERIHEFLTYFADAKVINSVKTTITRAQLQRAEAEYRLWCAQNPIKEK